MIRGLPAKFTVAIDGPAAAGKSTVGALVADKLEALYFDTGVLYRAVTYAANLRGIRSSNETALAAVAQSLDLEFEAPTVDDGRRNDVVLNGIDVTTELSALDVDSGLSTVSAYASVRKALLDIQRRIALSGRVVMTGRDIGTVVVPDAEIKIFLDASLQERARRRLQDMLDRGEQATIDDVTSNLARRDRIDSERSAAPLTPADDALILVSDDLTADQAACAIVMAVVTRFTEFPDSSPDSHD